ncbi:MAG: Histidine kinase, gyrase and HSP90-like ATPase [Herbinix sp.]|jgi:sensor histidine kinase YesM|nr:Histidine kinase, gyrase and HSP90-like ATPase [Herbinix sp.]
MENVSKFKEQMQRSVLKRIIALIIEGAILFIVGLLVVNFATNEINANNNLKRLKETFISLYQHNENYLMDSKTMELCREILLDKSSTTSFENSFNRLNMNYDVKNEVILCDTDWNIEYTSYSDKEISSYHHNYNNAICYNARNCGENEIYNAVYSNMNNYSDYIFVKPVFDQGKIIGYLSLYLLGSDWNYYMSDWNFDGVITDKRNNVIFYSKPSLITNNYKFEVGKSRIGYLEKDRYWMVSEQLQDYEVTIYSLIYNPNNSTYLIGLAVIVVMGFLWYQIANQMASSMAENNAASINKLVKEIRIIRKKDHNHRVEMDSGDEFEDVAYQINYMLDNIRDLNTKNTELLKLNNIIEMNQLTAQINPHFLYNTLEIIRNLVLQDGVKAEELIVRLTQVLRYSINNSKRDVMLEEDIKYIRDYISIQSCRFGDRFICNVDIDQECGTCIIPKLVLQPIIENSIKYGFKKKMNLRIDIHGYRKDNILYLSVKDDGMGTSEEEAERLNESMKEVYNDTASNGLRNIARRLWLQYGEKSGIRIVNEEGVGFEVILTVVQTL